MNPLRYPKFSDLGTNPIQKLKKASFASVLTLAYQSLGVVYGDLSTSPLYVYKTTFSGKLRPHKGDVEIYGVLSFIFWTLTLIALCKYTFIVMSANDNGEGGTFALYSLLCRHAKLSILPNEEDTDKELSSYAIEGSADTWQSTVLKSLFEKYPKFRSALLIFVLLGTCMAIGDGILTPAISVLSAVSGIKVKVSSLHENYTVVISCIILVALFSIQHHGTSRVAFLFAPIITAWLLCISGIGTYNIFRWNPHIFHALSPMYMLHFMKKTGKEGWMSLGGVVLSITGLEAMFADLGHFSALSIKVAFTFLVYPCLVLAYLGEAAFLSKHHEDVESSFYQAIPEAVFWPVFIVATLAAAVGSQAVISATFSIISQCCALHCFPRVKIVHSSRKIYGQVYIPEVNWILMCLCIAVTIALKDENHIGHAYGLTVTSVMFVTTCLMTLVMIIVWKLQIIVAAAFLVFFGSVEILYLSAALFKVPEGGWIPLLMSWVLMALMFIWNFGTIRKHQFDMENRVSMGRIMTLGHGLGMVRVPGIGLVYTNIVKGIPAIFGHFVTNLPAFHEVLIFVCIKSVQVPRISEEERLSISRVSPKEYGMYRCIIRYGYKDVPHESYDFENRLISGIMEFIEREGGSEEAACMVEYSADSSNWENESLEGYESRFSYPDDGGLITEETKEVTNSDCEQRSPCLKDETLHILKARESGLAYIVGHSYARAKKSSSVYKKFAINVVYSFLSRNSREPDGLSAPHTSLMEVGMVYHV